MYKKGYLIAGEKHGMYNKKHKSETIAKIKKTTTLSLSKTSVRNKMKGPRPQSAGKNSVHWKGNDIKYGRKHKRIVEQKGKASNYKCIDCNEQARDWSNIDHKYSLNPDDYQPRCVRCHKKYDIELNNI